MSASGMPQRPPRPVETGGAPSTPPGGDIPSLVAERRRRLDDACRPAEGAGTWGLALSGGGIRSATFCFGLLKALAKNGVLHRFDLLSTVSGGGYIGSAIGRLYHDAVRTGQGARGIESALADAETRWFAFWLRANGRYLIPRGGRDVMFAAANFTRNLIGVHIELALMCLLLGCALVGLDLALWQWADCLYSGNACWRPAWMTMGTLDVLSRVPSLWILLPPLALAAAALGAAYWALPARAGERLPLQRWITVVLCAAGCWMLARHWTAQQMEDGTAADTLQLPGGLLLAAGCALTAWPLGTVVAQAMTLRHPRTPDESRHLLTASLAHCLNAGLVVVALGLADLMAWALAGARAGHQGAAGAAIVLAVAALRAVLPRITDLPRSLTPGTRANLNGLVNLAGAAMLALLLVFWVSIVHRSATIVLFDETRRVLQFPLGWRWLGVIAVPVALMVAVSFRNRDFLNRSSLYAFYRARLVRSYLGAGNVARFGGHPGTATEPYGRRASADGSGVSVQDVHADDDIAMAEYAPHAAGGPVHLINACVNQTCDPRGGLFNQDRKGMLLTVGPHGRVRVGQEPWRAVPRDDALTLGSWVAISGAAVAPGLGSSTRSGIASLLTLAGLRLGYWWNTEAMQAAHGEDAPRGVGKYAQLLAELRGRFSGTRRVDWYLSDGGHFENTAAYALLQEECALAVVADCGADPRYAFGDLENLVRKARTDLQADITFLKPRLTRDRGVRTDRAPGGAGGRTADPAGAVKAEEGAAPPPSAEALSSGPAAPPAPEASSVFGSLNDLASPDSQACLALARIDYRSGKSGYLVVVKPNMCAGVSVDLVNFKADNPLFPQEPTTDQSFSEAQWESYFHLGQTLGLNLVRRMLDDLPSFAEAHFEIDDGSVIVRDERGKAHAAPAPKRLPSRIAATGAITASVSLGALATLGATAWQAVDQQMQAQAKARRMDPAVLKELTDLYGRLMPDAAPAAPLLAGMAPQAPRSPATEENPSTRLGEMATALLRIGDAACTLDNTEAFRRSALMQLILTSTKRSCRASNPRHPSCDVLLDEDRSVACLHERALVSCTPRYWVRDYLENDPSKQNCLPTPPASPLPRDGAGAQPGPEASGLRGLLERLGLGSAIKAFAPSPSLSDSAPDAASAPAPAPSPDVRSGPASAPSASPAPGADAAAGRSAPASAAGTASPAPDACKGKTVYIQIYGPELRDRVRLLREPWRALGASVPPVEDVWDSARRRGREAPRPLPQPTVIYHDAGSEACARQLPPADSATDWTVRALPAQLSGTPGTIEVWIPPATGDGSGAAPSSAPPNAPPPARSFCYQEDVRRPGAQRFGVHCHAEAAACAKARGDSARKLQSACAPVDTSGVAALLNRRGWGGSWYAMQAQPFGAPFPSLPPVAGSPP